MNDTRLPDLLADKKAATAADDDCRSKIAELLDQSPDMPERARLALQANYDALNLMVQRGEAVIGSLTRILEEGWMA